MCHFKGDLLFASLPLESFGALIRIGMKCVLLAPSQQVDIALLAEEYPELATELTWSSGKALLRSARTRI